MFRSSRLSVCLEIETRNSSNGAVTLSKEERERQEHAEQAAKEERERQEHAEQAAKEERERQEREQVETKSADQVVEEVKEVSEEPETIQNGDFDATTPLIHGTRAICYFLIDNISRDEDIVVNARLLGCDFV